VDICWFGWLFSLMDQVVGGGGVSLFSSFHFCSGVNSICNGLPTQQPVRDTLDFPSENHVCHAA
jgi:hypothetical protein